MSEVVRTGGGFEEGVSNNSLHFPSTGGPSGATRFSNTDEGAVLGAALRRWSEQEDYEYLALLLSSRGYLPKKLVRLLDTVEIAVKAGAESSEDCIHHLQKNGFDRASTRLADCEMDSPALTRPYFLKRIKALQSPSLARKISSIAEGIVDGGTNLATVIDFLTKEQARLEPDSTDLKLLSLEELALQPKVDWLIEGIIPSNSLTCVYGPPGSGKSFMALDMALRLAQGEDWEKRDTSLGSGVYIAAEGVSGLSDRVAAWRRYYGIESDGFDRRFSVIGRPIDVSSQAQRLIDAIKIAGVNPDLVVVDTLARCFGANDENNTADMTAFIMALDYIRIELGCTVMVVHHCSRGETKNLRGNSAFEGALDTLIKVDRMERKDGVDQRVVAQVVKQKDAEGGQKFFYELHPVDGISAVLRGVPPAVIDGENRGTQVGLLRALKDLVHSPEQWVTATEWRKAYPTLGPDFGPAIGRLVSLGHVEYKRRGNSDTYRPAPGAAVSDWGSNRKDLA